VTEANILTGRKPVVVVGVDLAGSARRPTGICVLSGLRAETHVVFGDDEVLQWVSRVRPDLVPIDAPLSLPDGRETIHDRSGGHFRDCDRELKRRGIRFFPITLGPMRMLTECGMALKAEIEAMGSRAVECYPGAAQDLWGIPRQHKNRAGLLAGLRKLGVKGLPENISGDELDAATAALVGRWFLQGKGELIGGDAGIVIPSARR
jgi:predicted nuclease with RNAse H fold